MIISRSLRFVYIGPPKTGTTTMHNWLVQSLLFDKDRDIDTRANGGQHDFTITPDVIGYYICATIRDQDSWLDSLWRQSRNDFLDYKDDDHPLMSWEEFLAWREHCGNPFYSRNMCDYYPQDVDKFLWCEHLEKHARQLPFAAPLWGQLKPMGHENHNKRCPRNTVDR